MKYSILLLLAVPALMLPTACSHRRADDAARQAEAVEVALPVVDSVTLYKTYPGYTYSDSKADIVARVNGTLLTRTYSAGTIVERGQVLFTIESTRYADAVTKAEAALATAKSQYEYLSRQYVAMEKALESDAVSQMAVIQARADMEQAKASIDNASAALNDARTMLGYCTIRAPFSGHISGSTVDPGAYVSGEGSPFTLATIYDDADVAVQFAIEDSEYERIMAGVPSTADSLYRNMPVSFQKELPHSYTADLNYTAPVVDKKTGTITLKSKIHNTYGELRDGMYATISIPTGVNPRAVLVRDASLGTDQLGRYLYVVDDSDRVVYTPVKVGDKYGDSLRIVTEGITPQSRYVTRAMLKVRDGMKVNPVMVK